MTHEFPGDAVLAEALGAGLEHLQRDLEGQLAMHRQPDASATRHAFEALALLAAAGLKQASGPAQIDPEGPVVVPWWVVSALGDAWRRYRFEGEPLHRALDLSEDSRPNPLARGPGSPHAKTDKELYRWGLAVEVAKESGGIRGALEGAVETVRERWGIKSKTTVWTAWKTYRDAALRAVAPTKT